MFSISEIAGAEVVPPAEDEVALPAKAINQIIKDTLGDTRLATECRELLHQCCLAFIHELTDQALHLSNLDQRKTMTHEHVVQALQAMGFSADYVQSANSVLEECQQHADRRLKRKNSRLENCGIPEEELYRQQQALIETARLQQEASDHAEMEAYRVQLEEQQEIDESNNDNTTQPQSTSRSTNALIDDDYDC